MGKQKAQQAPKKTWPMRLVERAIGMTLEEFFEQNSHLSQTEMAEKLVVDRQTIGKWLEYFGFERKLVREGK